jgi:hypothetical protein
MTPEKGRCVSMAGKSIKIGRDAKNGQFIPVKVAIRRPNTSVVETIKK